MRTSSRYVRMMMAAAVGVALALSCITAASASAAPSRGPALSSASAAVPGQLASVSVPGGPEAWNPVIITDSTATSGVIGYLICLAKSPSHCISDTANLGNTGTVITDILTTAGDGYTVWSLIKSSHKSYEWIKKYLYKGKHIYTGKGDGLCMADFGYNQKAVMASCGDKHGIYWQDATGQFWNTYAKGDLIASSLKSRTRLFVHKQEDWATWGFEEVCLNKC